MTKPLSEILSEALAIVEKSTPGELSVYDANEGDGWPPRPLWCFKNEAYDSEDEQAAALQGSVHYGGKEDAESIAAAINFLRHHGHALAALARRVEASTGPDVWSYSVDNKNSCTLKWPDGSFVDYVAEQQYPEAAEVCGEAYQVVGSLLDDLGVFNTPEAEKVLDNLSQHRMVHADVLPWPSFRAAPPTSDGGDDGRS